MITCAEAVARLWEYLERQLPSADAARVDEHLSLCRRCCGEAEFAGELRGFLGAHTEAMVPRDARVRIETFLQSLDAEATAARGDGG